MNFEARSSSPEDTVAIGKQLGNFLRGREVFLISGELGSGKTVLAKGIASALDIPPSEVVSPSFVLMNVYQGKFKLYHFDLYRLGGDISADCGIDEYLDEGVILVEWAQNLAPICSGFDQAVRIRIDAPSDRERRIHIETSIEYIRFP
jgi:tRNA threonylcarbamoyladenosine biosynthesis protein TsaE